MTSSSKPAGRCPLACQDSLAEALREILECHERARVAERRKRRSGTWLKAPVVGRFLAWLGVICLLNPAVIHANIAIIGPLAREFNVTTGDVFAGDVLVRNTGTAATTVRVSQADYAFSASGDNSFPSPGTLARSNAPWITVDNTVLELKAGETAPVHFQGQVPAGLEEAGSRWSLLFVQEATSAAEFQGVRTIARYGVQIVTDLGDSGTRSVRILNRRTEGKAPAGSLQLDLQNDGERLIFPQVSVELFTKEGTKIGRFESKPDRVYPECSLRAGVPLGGVPSGTYQAVVLIDCGDDQIIGTRCEISL